MRAGVYDPGLGPGNVIIVKATAIQLMFAPPNPTQDKRCRFNRSVQQHFNSLKQGFKGTENCG
jgi:hypothetical protein